MYQSPQRRQKKSPWPKLPKFNFSLPPLGSKLVKFLLAGLVFALMIVWFFMGDFRFMMSKWPSFAGFPFGERSYLVLVQNNYNLDAKGGGVMSYGTLNFGHGFYKGLEFYEDEFPETSAIQTEPDFSTIGSELVAWHKEKHPQDEIHGVIAVDIHFLMEFLKRFDSMYVDGIAITPENGFSILSLDAKKSGALLDRMISKTVFFPWRIPGALKVLSQGMEEKHVLTVFEKNGLKKAFAKRNWSGHMPEADFGDFLSVNLVNLSNLSSDRYLSKEVTYELEFTPNKDVLGSPVLLANLKLELKHEGSLNPPFSGPYEGQVKIMIPLGSDLVTQAKSSSRKDATVLSEQVLLNPGESITYSYQYELPEYVWNNGTYHLHLRKQLGSDAIPHRVVLRLPADQTVESSMFDVRENLGVFAGNLYSDLALSFMPKAGSALFRITDYQWTKPDEIRIDFNEKPVLTNADPLSSGIMDLDRAVKELTDSLTVKDIDVQGNSLVIRFDGVSLQVGESYSFELSGLENSKGDPLAGASLPIVLTQSQAIADLLEQAEPEVEAEQPEPEAELEKTAL